VAETRSNLLLILVAATPVLTANALRVNTKRVPRNGDAIAMAEDDDAQLVVDINTASITSMAPPQSHSTSIFGNIEDNFGDRSADFSQSLLRLRLIWVWVELGFSVSEL
jgi:hypothetical protein